MLTSTKPVHKEPPAAFAKRDQPVQPEAFMPPAAASETTGQAASPEQLPPAIIPVAPMKVEEVAALQFAPPQPQPAQSPAPSQVIAPESASAPIATPSQVVPPVPPARPAARTAPEPINADPVARKEQLKKATAVKEKKEPPRIKYAERRKKHIQVVREDDSDVGNHTSHKQEPRGGDFFSFLFGGN